MIRIENVSKTYKGTHMAVRNLSMNIGDGKIFGFIGPNGAGKTTTIKMITGILRPDSGGRIIINGSDIEHDGINAKKQIGYVPDNPDMLLRLKGIEYLNLLADAYGVPFEERKSRIESLMAQFEMDSALGDYIQSYSHGMRQKIVLIGALLHDPAVWILDEPMTGLDPHSAFILKNMMRKHADEGKTVFFSTHVLEVAEKICDEVAVINNGMLLFCGPLQELRNNFNGENSLENIFMEMTDDRMNGRL